MMSVSPSGRERKARDSNPQPMKGHCLARSFLTNSDTFRMSVDRPGIEPGFPPRQGGVVPLDHESVMVSGPDGNRTHHTDLARINRPPWYMPARFRQRSVRESNPQSHEALDLVALPVCVPGHFQVAGPGVAPGGRNL